MKSAFEGCRESCAGWCPRSQPQKFPNKVRPLTERWKKRWNICFPSSLPRVFLNNSLISHSWLLLNGLDAQQVPSQLHLGCLALLTEGNWIRNRHIPITPGLSEWRDPWNTSRTSPGWDWKSLKMFKEIQNTFKKWDFPTRNLEKILKSASVMSNMQKLSKIMIKQKPDKEKPLIKAQATVFSFSPLCAWPTSLRSSFSP